MKKQIQSVLVAMCVVTSVYAQKNVPVSIKVLDDKNRVEVYIGSQLFTAYWFDPSMEKPFLYPVNAPNGTIVTRGFPMEPREKERVDHPHQVGLWFNYGDVSGFDFWNNSYAVPKEEKSHFGRIIHRAIEEADSGGGMAVLKVKMDWVAPDNEHAEKLLEESTTYIFSGSEEVWMVDRITTLTAVADRVVFNDNKEGMLAIRVDRAFELPSDEPVVYTDASGKSTEVAVMDNEGVNGWYRNSEGDEGNDAWGKNARWVELTGSRDGAASSLILMDHPQNINFPACWHARGYGLFSVNNLGRNVYNGDLDRFQLVLNKGESITFKHRFVVATGKLKEREVEAIYKDFTAQ